jgi:hypothetical protein
MRKYVLTLAVLAAVPLPSLAMAGDAEQANAVVAAGAVQLSDEEMDNVSAAGLGKASAPGQLMRANRLLLQSQVPCAHGKSCYAPGKTFGASSLAHTIHQ